MADAAAATDRPRVLVVGDVAVDVVARPVGEPSPDGDTQAAIRIRGGGSAANTAVWLARAGARPTLVGRVGADPAGTWVRADLEAAGVVARLVTDPTRPTAAVVAITDDGGRTMLSDRGAAAALAPGDLPRDLLERVDAVVLSGYVLLDGRSREAGLALLDRAREAGVPFAVDPSWATGLAAVAAEFRAWVAGVRWLLPNADEARVLAGVEELEVAAHRLADLAAEVAVTDGPRPAWWCDGGTPVAVPVAPVPRQGPGGGTGDAVGAGDAFTAGFLTARLRGVEGPSAVRAGLAMAARALQVTGGR